jgi:hypothetical protein
MGIFRWFGTSGMPFWTTRYRNTNVASLDKTWCQVQYFAIGTRIVQNDCFSGRGKSGTPRRKIVSDAIHGAGHSLNHSQSDSVRPRVKRGSSLRRASIEEGRCFVYDSVRPWVKRGGSLRCGSIVLKGREMMLNLWFQCQKNINPCTTDATFTMLPFPFSSRLTFWAHVAKNLFMFFRFTRTRRI